MTDQPGYVLDEAFKLFETVRRRMQSDPKSDDVWSQATRAPRAEGSCPHGCPLCKTMEAARSSGPDVISHVVDAGQSLFAAFQDVLAGYESARPPRSENSSDTSQADQGPIDIG